MSGGRGGGRWRGSREVRSSGAISTSDTGGAVGTRSAFAFAAADAAAPAYRYIKTIKIIWISIIHDPKQQQAALITLFPSWKILQIKNHTFDLCLGKWKIPLELENILNVLNHSLRNRNEFNVQCRPLLYSSFSYVVSASPRNSALGVVGGCGSSVSDQKVYPP